MKKYLALLIVLVGCSGNEENRCINNIWDLTSKGYQLWDELPFYYKVFGEDNAVHIYTNDQGEPYSKVIFVPITQLDSSIFSFDSLKNEATLSREGLGKRYKVSINPSYYEFVQLDTTCIDASFPFKLK